MLPYQTIWVSRPSTDVLIVQHKRYVVSRPSTDVLIVSTNDMSLVDLVLSDVLL